MEIIIPLIMLIAFALVLIPFFDLTLSIALYVLYMILVPCLQFSIAGFSLSYNLVNTIFLLSFIYQFKKSTSFEYKVITPFLFLYFSLLILSVFSWDTPWFYQFDKWRYSFMQTCILPFIMWNISVIRPNFFVYIKWALIISVVIAGIYGLFLTLLGGINPYISFVSGYFQIPDYSSIYSESDPRFSFSTARGIQSTMIHPMTWSLLLCLLFIVFWMFYREKKTVWNAAILCLIGLNVLLSGVRTGVAALIIGFAYYLIRIREIKIFIYGLIIIGVFFFAINLNDESLNFFSSFVDVSGTNTDVQGSSISVRLDQLQGSFDEIKRCIWVGKGFDWNTYYVSKHGDHPVILAFESLIFIVLCNSGILGVCIWSLFFLLLFRLNRKILASRKDVILVDTLVLVYFAFAIGTGEYGYIHFFSIYYTFLIGYLFKLDNDLITNEL